LPNKPAKHLLSAKTKIVLFPKFRLLEHLRHPSSRLNKPCIIRAIAAGSAQVLLERLRRERSLEPRGWSPSPCLSGNRSWWTPTPQDRARC
jgi:hypothetical protein